MAEDRDDEEAPTRSRFSRLGEQLTGLLDPESALRRGQGLVTGVTQATKEELMRIVSSEVRSFLDKMDAAELVQQVIAGLVVDVKMQIRFSRDSGQPHVETQELRIGSDADGKPEPRESKGESRESKGEPRESRGEPKK